MRTWSEIFRAKELLQNGKVVGLPTETVYGLAGLIDKAEAIREIFRIKDRPSFDPLIVHIGHINQAKKLFLNWTPEIEQLACRFWPGPLTIVAEKTSSVSDTITAGLSKVGVRMPAHSFARWLARKAGPFAAPSANMFGKTSPSSASHVRREFGEKLFVLDGGDCKIGIESTVVEIEDGVLKIIRPGMISESDLYDWKKQTASRLEIVYAGSSAAPGQLKTHYQPPLPLALTDKKLSPSATLEKLKLPSHTRIFILNLGEDAFACARSLYKRLREPEAKDYDLILVEWSSDQTGPYWKAIRDRLERAATYRIS